MREARRREGGRREGEGRMPALTSCSTLEDKVLLKVSLDCLAIFTLTPRHKDRGAHDIEVLQAMSQLRRGQQGGMVEHDTGRVVGGKCYLDASMSHSMSDTPSPSCCPCSAKHLQNRYNGGRKSAVPHQETHTQRKRERERQ